MLEKFLYAVDEKERKVIVGVVENNDSVKKDVNLFPMSLKENYNENMLEKATFIHGDLVYAYFNTKEGRLYLDINIFKNQVKVQLSPNIGHACCYSKEFIEVVLYNMDYFNLEEDPIFVSSGFYRPRLDELKDNYDNLFRKAPEVGYVAIRDDEGIKFVVRNEDETYSLTEDLRKASRIARGILRRVLTVNNLIDRNIERRKISFSENDILACEDGYYFNGVHIHLVDNVLTISSNDYTLEDGIYRLISNKDAYNRLKGLYFDLTKEHTENLYLAKYNNKYLHQDGMTFSFVSDPHEASKIDNNTFKMLNSCLKLFDTIELVKETTDSLCLYQIDDNLFEITDEKIEEYKNVSTISKEDCNLYQTLFNKGVKTASEGVILLSENNYLKYETVDDTKFTIEWVKSGSKATIFTQDEADLLVRMLSLKVKRREIKSILSDEYLKINNIFYDREQPTYISQFNRFVDTIINHKHRIQSFTTFDSIRTESEKGALEYLRRFYLNSILDSKSLFNRVFTKNPEIKNIFIVGSGCNLDLIALNEVLKEKNLTCNVSLMDHAKWGFYPTVCLSNVKIKAVYRFNFASVTKPILEEFDMILFSRGFNDSYEQAMPVFEQIDEIPSIKIIAEVKFCNLSKTQDSFWQYYSQRTEAKRKHFIHKPEEYQEILEANDDFNYKMVKEYNQNLNIPEPIHTKEYSYHAVLLHENGKYLDFYKK